MNFTTPGRVALCPGNFKLFPFAELNLFFARNNGQSPQYRRLQQGKSWDWFSYDYYFWDRPLNFWNFWTIAKADNFEFFDYHLRHGRQNFLNFCNL